LTGKIASQILLDEQAQEKINIQERKKRRQGKEGLYEIKIKKKNGEYRNWIISGVPVHDNKNKIKGSIGIHWDVTETRKTDSKFLFDSIQKEKQLLEARIQAEENQREIIGRDLHDGIGQMLVYLGLYLKLLKEKKTIKHTDIEKAESTIQKTLDETRRLSRNLAPPTIKELGLKDSIVELIGSFSILLKPTFKLNIYKGSDPEKLQYDQKIMMYRIVQELCSNTFKYANAKKVSIDLLGDIHGLNLKYHDDGIGFDTKKMKTGIGLKGILSRVEYYGGKFVIESSPQKGIQVLLNLPFK
jgi:signal transduction histidine kinase